MALVADEGLAPLRRPQRHPQEELPLGVLLPHRSRADARGCWPPGTSSSPATGLFAGRLLQPRLPLRALLRRAPASWSGTTCRRAAAASPASWSSWPRMPTGRAFCYSNADLRKGEEAEEVFRFIAFWKRTHGELPAPPGVRLASLTTYANLARLDADGHRLHHPAAPLAQAARRRSSLLPRSAWRTVELDVPTRKYRPRASTSRPVQLAGRHLPPVLHPGSGPRGADHPPDQPAPGCRPSSSSPATPSACSSRTPSSDAVRFFHMDALSSAVGLKVDFDMALLVIASGLYRLLARRMRGYADAQARQIFRDLIDMPADVTIDERARWKCSFHRRPTCPSSSPPVSSTSPCQSRGGTALPCA